ncbi:MAG: 23S rRNA (adenine(2503)-C(2))-methyltransferase RlmN [Pirellulales bacterium]
MSQRPLLELTLEELRGWFVQRGQPAYRADQVRRWLFARRADEFAAMTDLPAALRAALADEFTIFAGRVAAHRRAPDGTHKLLVAYPDGSQIECVLIPEDGRRTICISTQVGCAMGCVFCASGLEGVRRNLTRGEIVEQMLRLDRLLPAGERITHIVVMGMGEPLVNLENLLAALAVAGDKEGLGIGARRVTISTVGLPEGIRRLAEAGKQYHLAVSLHAPDDALRDRLVPVNRRIGVRAILEACGEFFQRTGRQVTYEYVLLAGVNDRPEQARALVRLLGGRKAYVNVIPYNPVAGLPYRTPTPEAAHRFAAILRRGGVAVNLRRRKGAEIDAACGQLRLTRHRPEAVTAGEATAPRR